MRAALWIVTTLIVGTPLCCTAATEGDGLQPWPQWQGRLSLGTSNPLGNPEALPANSNGLNVRSFSLMGDYYFAGSALRTGTAGGFRATSGLIVGARASGSLFSNGVASLSGRALNIDHHNVTGTSPSTPVDSAPEPGAVPYLGIGYTELSSKGGWGFSADVGVVALSPRSTVKLGRVLGGAQSLDDVLRDMRLSPLLQLGVRYSF